RYRQRAAEIAAELVAAEWRLLRRARVDELVLKGVELVVADEFEQAEMKVVRARFGGDGDDACAAPELRRKGSGQRLELAHRFDRRLNDARVERVFIVVNAVDQPAVGVGVVAQRVEIRRGARIEGGSPRQILARLPWRHARRQIDQLREVAPVERQFLDGA